MSESEVQVLRNEFQGLEKLLTERFDQTEKHRSDLFKQVLDPLKETNELLRGKNENPGMNGRLNHLEKMQKIFLGVFLTILAGFVVHYFGWIEKMMNAVSG